MKSSITEGKPVETFKPFTLNIEIENMDDAQKIYALFDACLIIDKLDINKSAVDIRQNLSSSTNGYIEYGSSNPWFNKLMDILK